MDHFARAAVAVEEESPGGPRFAREDLEHRSPGFEIVNARRKVQFGGDAELANEDFFLPFPRKVGLPSVESNFANRGWRLAKKFAEALFPGRGSFVDVPGVVAEAGDDEVGIFLREGEDLRPVGLAGSIDDHAGDAGGAGFGDELFDGNAEPIVLQVIMGVEEVHAE